MKTLDIFELIDEYSRLDDERQELRSLLEAAKENLACFEGTLNILDASEEDLEKLDDLKDAVDAADEELVMWNEENLDRYNELEDVLYRIGEHVNNKLGMNIRKAREAKGLTVDDLAALTSIPVATLIATENAQMFVTVRDLWLITQALKVKISVLLKGIV